MMLQKSEKTAEKKRKTQQEKIRKLDFKTRLKFYLQICDYAWMWIDDVWGDEIPKGDRGYEGDDQEFWQDCFTHDDCWLRWFPEWVTSLLSDGATC